MPVGLLMLALLAAVFSPVAEAAPINVPINVALNQPTVANSVYDTNGPARAVDGNWQTQWSSAGHASPAAPLWMSVDLQGLFSIVSIVLVGPDSGIYQGYTNVYNLYSTTDGSTWNLLSSGTIVDGLDYVHTINTGGATMSGIMYEVVGGSHWAGLFEIEAYAESVPEPSSLLLVGGALGIVFLRLRRMR